MDGHIPVCMWADSMTSGSLIVGERAYGKKGDREEGTKEGAGRE